MDFIKRFRMGNHVYHIFYDSNLKAINYFYYIKETGETGCISLFYDVIKNFYDILTEENFKNKYQEIMDDILNRKETVVQKILNEQVFPKGFWQEIILKKFRNCEIDFKKINKND